MRLFLIIIGLALASNSLLAQCCSGGSGSPIAGGSSQGVLQERQFEVGLSHQIINTNKFLEGDKKLEKFLDKYSSNYIYGRIAYGITKAFTLSIESGYFINKTQVGLDKSHTIESTGIADIIIFPKYVVYQNNTEKTRTEITIGAGLKIPVGKFKDSTKYVEPFSGEPYYMTNPPAVQPTTGSNDFIFYGFLFRGYPEKNFRVFANLFYIKKGWNASGEKFGDYASIGLFTSKTLFKSLGVTLQVKGEWIDKMERNKDLEFYYPANYSVIATGSKKIFFIPQLSFNHKNFTVYALTEIPLYQYMNGTQVASQVLHTAGLSYRFFMKKRTNEPVPEEKGTK